jgi:hypothetical protein
MNAFDADPPAFEKMLQGECYDAVAAIKAGITV